MADRGRRKSQLKLSALFALPLLLAATSGYAEEVTIDQIPAELIELDSARPDECDGFDETDDPFYTYDLGEERTLYLLPCTSGAYNHFYSVYVSRIINKRAWYDLQLFAEPQGAAGWQAEKGVWLDAFDPATKVLSSYNLGNSMGACGTRGRWVWSGEGFFIIDYHAGGNCPDGPNEPGEFPLVYENTELPEDLRPPAE
jgi:hypothetical protein